MSTNSQRIGKYELQQRLGRGGMGEVWKAYDLQLRRYVAIKLLHADLQNDPEFITRFEREARLIASLSHPNIVQVHDFQVSRSTGSVNGSATIAYMVMDYVEGPTLADYISSTSSAGRFPPAADIVHLFTSIGLAIDYAHQQGMIHRDIKPANILLDKSNTSVNPMGEPILTDFGIAKLLGASTSSSSGLWHGTELYISPEQAQGYVGNERSDLYSLGIILYEICTGAFPFQGGNATEIMMQHIKKQPLAPDLINPQISPALTAVILRSIAKDPAARFGSALAMAAALAGAFNLPIPENLDLPASPGDIMSEPTLYQPRPSEILPDLQIVKTSTPPPASLSTPRLGTSMSGPVPMGNIPSSSTMAEAMASTPATPPPVASSSALGASSVANLTPPAPRRQRRRGLFIALLLLMLVLIGSGLAGFFLFFHGKQFTGHAYFVSSLSGVDDELLIDLHNVPNPSSGKSYYAWLLSDKSQHPVLSVFLGALRVSNGAVHVTYRNAQNTNLLGITSRFLVTEEDANPTPRSPSSDQQTWRYYAELPQAPNPHDTVNHLSMLDVLRNLLVDAPTIKEAGSGGLNSWLFKNTGKVLEFAGTARDYFGDPTSSDLMRQHFFRILVLLDSESYAQADLPANISPSSVIGAPVALLGLNPNDATFFGASYLGEVRASLSMLVQEPGATPNLIQQVNQINHAIDRIKSWLGQVQADARQLVKMTPAQLLMPSTRFLLDAMQTQAFYAYTGWLDPSVDKLQEGVTQIHFDIQQLATFDIAPYTSA